MPRVDEAALTRIIRDKFLGGNQDIPLDKRTRLLEEGLVDSFGLLQLALAIEAQVPGLQIPDQEITREAFGSIAAILKYLEAKKPS